MLGVTFDSKLKMDKSVYAIAAQAHVRVSSILRCKAFYNVDCLLRFYKCFVLSYIEHATPAVYHVNSFVLSSLDRVQHRMLEAVGLNEEDALFSSHLAPLCSRRDIALLGLLHRINLGVAPSCFDDLFYPCTSEHFPRNLRGPLIRHNRQFHDPIDASSSILHRRSIFGLIYTYNLLPQKVVDSSSVTKFQRLLQSGLKRAASSNRAEWQHLYSKCVRFCTVHDFQNLFSD